MVHYKIKLALAVLPALKQALGMEGYKMLKTHIAASMAFWLTHLSARLVFSAPSGPAEVGTVTHYE